MTELGTPNGPENRREHRARVLKTARIVFNGGYSAYDCRIKNLSSSGALLQMPSMLGIPTHFDIEIDKAVKARPCTVVWRTDTQMGVSFDDAPPAQPAGDESPRLRLVASADASAGDSPSDAPSDRARKSA